MMPDNSKPMPSTPQEALKEMAALFYVNVECSRAEHIVGMLQAAIAQPAQQVEAVGQGVQAVDIADMVHWEHPEYGQGYFATENCFQTLYAAPQLEAQQAGDVARDAGWVAQEAACWRLFQRVLRTGHIPGAAYGRRFKIIETCATTGDETEFNDFIGAINAMAKEKA